MGTNWKRGPFTRQQISAMTGVSDSTLNYWAREGVLRSSEGGGGKGQHRRFPGPEVNLAAVLERLRNYGVSISSLRQIADMCHKALDYMSAFNFTEAEEEAFFTINNERFKFLEDGYCSWSITHSDPTPPGFEGFERFKDGTLTEVRLTWEQNVAYWQRDGERSDAYPDALWRLAERTNPKEYSDQNYITRIFTRVPERLYSAEVEYFYREPNGDWVISPNTWVAERGEVDTFIAMELDRIFYRIWHDDDSTRTALTDAAEQYGFTR